MAALLCPQCGGTAYRFVHISTCRCGWHKVDPPSRRMAAGPCFTPSADTDLDIDDEPDEPDDQADEDFEDPDDPLP